MNIPVYEPFKAKNQKKYVMDCIDTNWISSRGAYIEQFEQALQNYLGVKHAIVVCNGSVSLMLILSALGIGLDDEVITTSLTYAATISAINNMGAKAVLVDSDSNFQMSLHNLEQVITNKTKALIVAQLYGDSANMDQLVNFCNKKNIYLIEDSAEVFGCSVDGKKLGTFGIASSFSFFGNKTITTGEGGCVCTNDGALAEKMRLLKSQSHIGNFIHNGPGYNFRMTNVQAAIGLAQLEDIDKIIKKKKRIAAYYRKHLSKKIKKIVPLVDSAEWMPLFVLPNHISYLDFYNKLLEFNIDSRPCFMPIHLMSGFNISKSDLSNAEIIYKSGFNLPSYPDLTFKQLKYICESVNKIVG